MLLTGKKLVLMSLVWVSTAKLVNACSYSPQFKEQLLKQLAERDFNVKLYFFSIIFLIGANIGVFFARKRNDYLLPFAILLTGLVSAPVTIVSILNDSCGNSIVSSLKINFYIFLGFLIFQGFLWISRTDLRFNRGKTTINFQ